MHDKMVGAPKAIEMPPAPPPANAKGFGKGQHVCQAFALVSRMHVHFAGGKKRGHQSGGGSASNNEGAASSQGKPQKAKTGLACWKCGKTGHFARKCRSSL